MSAPFFPAVVPTIFIVGYAIFIALRGRTWLHRAGLTAALLLLLFLPVYLYVFSQANAFFAGVVAQHPGMPVVHLVTRIQMALLALSGGITCALHYKEFCVRRPPA